MSRNTPSSRVDGPRLRTHALIFAALACASPVGLAAAAPPLPAAVAALAPQLEFRGGGEMTFFGFPVYDGWFWCTSSGFSLEHPLVLDLHYKRSLAGRSIAARSVDEIAKLGLGTPEQRAHWGELMRRIFPDVGDGDRLTGISMPPGVTRFFQNGRSIGEIDDREFTRAFFGIWLDPQTSRPDFRLKLLGAP